MAVNDPAIEALARVYLDLGNRLRQSLLTATVEGWEWRRSQALLQQVETELHRLNIYVNDWEQRQLRFQFDAGRVKADEQLAAASERAALRLASTTRAQGLRQGEAATWHQLATKPLEALSQAIAGQRSQFVGAILRQSRDYLRQLSSGEIARGLGLGNSPRDVGRAIRDGSIQSIIEGRPVQNLVTQIDRAVGVVYSDGSVHSLHAYGEMSARTGMMSAFTEASGLRYHQAGVHLVTVSTHGTLCFLCQPLEGKTFAIDAEGQALGYPPFNGCIPRHPNCQHSISPALEELGPYDKPDQAALQMTDRELYARMRDDVPGGKQLMEWSRKGFANAPQAERLTAQGIEHGPRYRLAGIEARRIEATKRVIESRGQLTYQQAMGQVEQERRAAIRAMNMPPQGGSGPGQAGGNAPSQFTPAATVAEARAIAWSSFRINASFSDTGTNLDILNNFNEAFAEAQSRGHALPSMIWDGPGLHASQNPTGHMITPAASIRDAIVTNSQCYYWQGGATSVAAEQAAQFAERWATSDSVLHVARHEIGHIGHYLNDPAAYHALHQRQFSDRMKERIKTLVSGYAATDPTEFVAEIRAGVMAGHAYGSRVMLLYRLYGGPTL